VTRKHDSDELQSVLFGVHRPMLHAFVRAIPVLLIYKYK